MKTACIVIPVYKSQPSESELYSLRCCQRVLGKYKAYLVTPKGLDISKYKSQYADIEQVEFGVSYFENIKGYNQLCMSSGFYKSFLHFDFMLLYQLDALVFIDELQDWCEKDYAYIGAPWIEVPPSGNKNPMLNMSKWLYNKVGNGGLSLRKTKIHYLNCLIFKPIMFLFPKNEDFFWSLFISTINPNYTKPTVTEALKFAFELSPRKAYELNQQKLPFGVHAWEKYDLDFWKPFLYQS